MPVRIDVAHIELLTPDFAELDTKEIERVEFSKRAEAAGRQPRTVGEKIFERFRDRFVREDPIKNTRPS